MDVVVEATGVPNVAARHAYTAIMSGTDVVNVSVEADTVVGPLLSRLADRTGTTYSMAYGDQPAKVVELYDWARTNGFDVVAAGRTSGAPAPHGTPDGALERYPWSGALVDELDPNPRMYNSFMDGTKVAVESCAIANALGLRPDARGMHHPTATVDEAPAILRSETEGGALKTTGVIECLDLTDADVTGFVVTKTDNETLRAYLNERSSVPTAGGGKYHLFHVPFHNAQETTTSIARVALDGEPTGTIRSQETEVVAAAKRDLGPGDELDGGGGYTIYGVLADAGDAAENGFVPFELLSEAEVVGPVETDEILTADDVELDTDSFLYRLRRLEA